MPSFLETYHALIEFIEFTSKFLASNFPLKKHQAIQINGVRVERGIFHFKINGVELSSDRMDEIYRNLPALLRAFHKILEGKELEIRNTKVRLDKLEEILAPELITNALKGGDGSDE